MVEKVTKAMIGKTVNVTPQEGYTGPMTTETYVVDDVEAPRILIAEGVRIDVTAEIVEIEDTDSA